MSTDPSIPRPRPRRRSVLLGVVALAVLALVTVSCGGGDDDADSRSQLERARAEGVTIGIANERPYAFEENGQATGEAPELARVVFSRLGIDDVDFEVVEFGALINGLNAGRFDMMAAGMFINPERASQVAFTDPDYCATTAFAVPAGNPENLTDFQSVIDTEVTLGVMSGAVEEDYAIESGVPEDRISAFQTTPDVFDALSAGRVQAVALTAITVREQVADLDGFEATEGFVPVIDGEEKLGCGAFAFRQDDTEFRNAFNDELNEMKQNDEILPIIERFGFTEAEVNAAKDVTVDQLAGS
jgi:polar amino acid transport system substrate-binding protein